jgi:5-hydroxyisourate hydrolase
MGGYLTTHVLDIAQGIPASQIMIQVWRLDATGERSLLKTVHTGANGRPEEPLLAGEELRAGTYELIFAVHTYFVAQGLPMTEPPFLGDVPLRFSIADENAHYHVPLLVSPWAYSTYRGS